MYKYSYYGALHYRTLPYLALACRALPWLAVPCLSLPCLALHYTTLHYITLHYVALRYVTLRCVTIHYVGLCYVTLDYIIHSVTLCYDVTLRYVTLRCVTLRYVALRYGYVTLRYVTLHKNYTKHACMHACIHTHTYTHAYTHTYIHTCVCCIIYLSFLEGSWGSLHDLHHHSIGSRASPCARLRRLAGKGGLVGSCCAAVQMAKWYLNDPGLSPARIQTTSLSAATLESQLPTYEVALMPYSQRGLLRGWMRSVHLSEACAAAWKFRPS